MAEKEWPQEPAVAVHTGICSIYSQEAERRREREKCSARSLFFSPGLLAHRMVLGVRVGPSHLNPVWKLPHRHAQRFVLGGYRSCPILATTEPVLWTHRGGVRQNALTGSTSQMGAGQNFLGSVLGQM